MADDQVFRVRVPVRCFARAQKPSGLLICGAEAHWQRAGVNGRGSFVCDEHRQPGDQPIAFPAHIPRLSVVVELVVAGASWNPGHAKAEAVERLIAAAGSVGAVLNLHSVLFTAGRYEPPAPEAAPNTSADEGKPVRVRQ